MEKHFKEEELKSFLLTVANYRFSENVEEYVKSIENIPKTSRTSIHYDFASRFPDEFNSYLLMVKGIFTKDKDFDFFFEQQREKFIKALDQIVSGKPLLEIEELKQIVEEANILQPKKIFEFCNEERGPFEFCNEDGDHVLSCKTVLYWDSVISLEAKTENDRTIQIIHKELEMFFSLACYSLSVFLADGGGGRIKRCARCNNFFSRERNDERNRFCSDDCRNLHNQEQRKTNDGKAQRVAYMRNRRAILRERKRAKERADELKRLMNGGYTRKQAEKLLNEN